ncbi:WD40 repeat domain-containing protein [Lignipirellula cremea]|uniref:Uncharacterized protein n=1 Tax=Lignipirellula cremea TaxID=2528010 RepID=A0A518DKY4_9BACT|nr:WD40 repeat domain-containing protein [Lignipirellula cremea]QDU92490.1 hypothetical protein Pla8534_02380 [Lignipirellula cremea]
MRRSHAFRAGQYLLTAACLLCLTATVDAQDKTPLGALIDVEQSPLGAALEAELFALDGVEWLERTEVNRVLAEQKLQLLFDANALGDRRSMGQLLKADLLIVLRTGKVKDQKFAELAAAETQGGLRLVAIREPLGDDLEATAVKLAAVVRQALDKYREEITHVFAVPPFISHDLTFENDYRKQAYAALLEETLLQQPGVLVVELQEAEALQQEFAVAAADVRLKRKSPVYLLGEYASSRADDIDQVGLTIKLQQGALSLKTYEQAGPAADAPEFLRSVSGQVLKIDPSELKASGPVAEAAQLAARAGRFYTLGDWDEALPLLEASLMLQPQQTELHDQAMHCALRITERLPEEGNTTAELREYLTLRMRAFEHMRLLPRGGITDVVTTPRALVRALTPDQVSDAPPEFQQFYGSFRQQQREFSLHLLDELADLFPNNDAVHTSRAVWRAATEDQPPAAKYADWKQAVIRYQDRVGASALMIYGYPAFQPKDLDTVEGRLFLGDLATSDAIIPAVQTEAADLLASFQRTDKPAVPTAAPPATTPAEEGASLSFLPLRLEYTNAKGRSEALRHLSGCLPIAGGVDLIWAKSHGLFALRSEGRLQTLWLPKELNTFVTSVCYDGSRVWCVVQTGRKAPEILAISLETGQTTKFTRDDGLPLLDAEEIQNEEIPVSLAMVAAIGPGEAVIAGYVGRTWLAHVVCKEDGEKQAHVVFEAKEKLGDRQQVQAEASNPRLAFVPTFIACMTAPESAGPDARPLLAIGRSSPPNRPLIVDTHDWSATVLETRWISDFHVQTHPLSPVSDGLYAVSFLPNDPRQLKILRLRWPLEKTEVAMSDVKERELLFDDQTLHIVGQHWNRFDRETRKWEQLGAVPWVFFTVYGASERIYPPEMKHDTITQKGFCWSQHLGFVVNYYQNGGRIAGTALVRFDGSGQPLAEVMSGRATQTPAAPPQTPARLPRPTERDNLWTRTVAPDDVAWSPDGKWVLTASSNFNRTIQLFEAETGRQNPNLTGGPQSGRAVTFSSNGRRCAASFAGGRVMVWSLPDLKVVFDQITEKATMGGVALSGDGALLATAGSESTSLWNLATGERLFQTGRFMPRQGYWLRFSADNQSLETVGYKDFLYRIHLADGSPLPRLESLHSVAGYLPDGRVVGRLSNDLQKVVAWDWKTSTLEVLLEDVPGSRVGESLTVSADGRRLAAYEHIRYVDGKQEEIRQIHLWDLGTKKKLPGLEGVGGYGLRRFLFSPQGDMLLGVDGQSRFLHWTLEP